MLFYSTGAIESRATSSLLDAPQYGGFCAYGVALGVLADIEDSPEAFAVSNGKLYVCSSAGSLRKFRADIDKNIEKADKQWLRINAL